MSDSTLNQFVSSGTAAERAAYTPTPPTPAAAPDNGYFFFETDTGLTYSWDGAVWVQTGGGGANSVTAAGTLTANRLVLGAGTKTVAEAASLGTTTTLLHGNAAGAPSFGAVVLTTDVSGVLPVANGGSGTASAPKVYSSAFSFTDAQIKALPTTYLEVVAAPAANHFLVFHYAAFYIDASAGAYTNVDDGYVSGFAITYGDWATDASIFGAWAGTSVGFHLKPYTWPVNNLVGDEFFYPTAGSSVAGVTNFKLVSWNDPGDFTGGNAANTLKGTVAYSLFNFSTGLFV